MNKSTLIVTVNEIEPCLSFWTGALGFEVTATVPHGERMGFAMLHGGSVELMYQSRASLEDDLGPASEKAGFPHLIEELASSRATLFVTVDALDPIIAALGDATVVVPRRQTFYGTDEIFVMAPCGTLVGFAAHIGEAAG